MNSTGCASLPPVDFAVQAAAPAVRDMCLRWIVLHDECRRFTCHRPLFDRLGHQLD